MKTILFASLVLLLGVGCAAKPQVRPDVPSAPAARPVKVAVETPSGTEGLNDRERAAFEARPILYELDSATLTTESQQMLQELASALRGVPNASLKISGHTCELGTTEYNLALGLRRAGAARDYLTALGVPSSRIEITSFGEERPALAANDEFQRQKNRRSEFTIALSPSSSAPQAPGTRTASAHRQ